MVRKDETKVSSGRNCYIYNKKNLEYWNTRGLTISLHLQWGF
jgi:hypothetical protein